MVVWQRSLQSLIRHVGNKVEQKLVSTRIISVAAINSSSSLGPLLHRNTSQIESSYYPGYRKLETQTLSSLISDGLNGL
ncbi:hypothetical protein ACHQM5_016103 [Ranunculus cassubicifolius]